MSEHTRFTIDQTADGTWAIFHQAPPVLHDDGTRSLAWRFPALLAHEMLDQPLIMLGQLADILNKHWGEE